MKPYKQPFLFMLLLLLAFVCHLPAQNISLKRYAPPGEIPMGLITGITQDPKGIMWFAGGGLYAYDGYQLKTYLTDPLNTNSLSLDGEKFTETIFFISLQITHVLFVLVILLSVNNISSSLMPVIF